MTPTEQDKELRKKIEKIPIAYSSDQGGEVMYFEDFGVMPSDIDDFYDELIKLITADRKRVALEARIDEISHVFRIVDGRIFWQSDISLAMPLEERIAELKAQQEGK